MSNITLNSEPLINQSQESNNTTINDSTTANNTTETHTHENIELEDSAINERDLEMNTQRSGEEQDEEENTTSGEVLLNEEFRERAVRHIDNIGRHFNILDRIFRRRTENGSTENGQGLSFDGVFSNLTAKPDNNEDERNAQNETLPTYDEAAEDIVPSYYGMDLNSSDMYVDEICIEGLPVGNIANLLWNVIVSTSFQFVGFLITYILHTSHAAKQGSRFGLGLTFLSYAYSMIPNNVTSKIGKYKTIDRYQLEDPNAYDDLEIDSDSVKQHEYESNLNHGFEEEKQDLPKLAVFIGLLGALITIKSIVDYIKVKKMERKYMVQDHL